MFTACIMRQSYTNKGSLTLKRLRNEAATHAIPTQPSSTMSTPTAARAKKRLHSHNPEKAKTEQLKRKASNFLDSVTETEPGAKRPKLDKKASTPTDPINAVDAGASCLTTSLFSQLCNMFCS